MNVRVFSHRDATHLSLSLLLAEASVDLSALAYLRTNKPIAAASSASVVARYTCLVRAVCLIPFSQIISGRSSASSVARGLFDNLLDRGAGLFAGMKNILPVSKDFTVTKIVDALLNHKATAEVENYLYFDPKLARKCAHVIYFFLVSSRSLIIFNFPTDRFRDSAAKFAPKQQPAFSEAIVFMVGGGNYIEFQNLQVRCFFSYLYPSFPALSLSLSLLSPALSVSFPLPLCTLFSRDTSISSAASRHSLAGLCDHLPSEWRREHGGFVRGH